MLFNYKFDKNETYLLACSFGPDSMALFDMLLKQNAKIVCCHVNYHKRGIDSDNEENNLRKYCEEHNVPFEVLDARTIKKEGNFQEWAREIRYMFFAQMYAKYNAKGVFIGHQQDDLIETYIMQTRRGGRVEEYGLKEVSQMRGMTIIRPLLKYTKGELAFYDRENQVPYAIDSSNLSNDYTRNQIRHDIIDKLSTMDREHFIQEIQKMNREQEDFEEELKQKVTIDSSLDIRTIIALNKREFKEVLIKFVNTLDTHVDLSDGYISEIRKICLCDKPNVTLKLADNVYLLKEYDVLIIASSIEPDSYSYRIAEPSSFSCPQFDLDFSAGASDRNIYPSSYPLTIRSAKDGDNYQVGPNLCSVKRLFIDWKMPSRLRKSWPVIVDRTGKIIYIPRYRKNYVDNHDSKFVIKIS